MLKKQFRDIILNISPNFSKILNFNLAKELFKVLSKKNLN